MGSDNSLIDNLPLMGRSQAELPGKIAELRVAQAHGD
jgi:hypothetical protein